MSKHRSTTRNHITTPALATAALAFTAGCITATTLTPTPTTATTRPYTINEHGITLNGRTFTDNGHLNTRLTTGQTLNVHFEAKCRTRTDAECAGNPHTWAAYIDHTYMPWTAIPLPQDACIEWVQLDGENYHYGENGEPPVGPGCNPTTPTPTVPTPSDPTPTDPTPTTPTDTPTTPTTPTGTPSSPTGTPTGPSQEPPTLIPPTTATATPPAPTGPSKPPETMTTRDYTCQALITRTYEKRDGKWVLVDVAREATGNDCDTPVPPVIEEGA